MRSYVELVDLRSGNVVANYADEHEAWQALRRAALEFGLEEVTGLGLARVEDDRPTLIAMEDDLVRRVSDDLGTVAGAAVEPRADAPHRAAS